jgi:ABC-type uncharacterized transport system substrate-binding protein
LGRRAIGAPSGLGDLVQLNPDVILVAATPVVQAIKNATTTIPIVIAHPADPVQTGFCLIFAYDEPEILPSSSR